MKIEGSVATGAPPDYPCVEGELRFGETDGWARRANRHLTGEPWPNLMATGPLILATLAAIVIAGLLKHPAVWAAAVVVGIVAFRLRPWLWRRLAVKRLKHTFAIRDVHFPLPASMTVTDTQVQWSLGVFDSRCPIDAVSDVRRLGPFWLLTVQGVSVFLPDRNFQSDDHRRTVFTALRDGMKPEAVARSPDLTALLS